MRLLLTGKNGQLGFELQRALAPLGVVAALDRSSCNLESEESIRASVRQFRPDWIINAAAYTAVDRAETDPARAESVNSIALAIIGDEANRLGAAVVHYSTDYVFDGKTDGYYREGDPTGPQGVYGKTKLAGEQALAASGAQHLIFRTSWVFGGHGANFAKTMLRLASERDELSVVADQHGAPTPAALIADVTAHVIRQAGKNSSMKDIQGVYHLVSSGETSWYDYACYVLECARRSGVSLRVAPDAVRPIKTADYPTPAKRPANSKLDTAKLRETFDLTLPNWETGVDHVLQQIL